MVGATVLVVSFCIALYVIDVADEPHLAQAQRDADEVALAPARGFDVGGGVRVYSASAEQGGTHTAEHAFGDARSPDHFWEAEGGFPINLIVVFPAARTINGYVLSSGQFGDRMPVSWLLEGSRDGIAWFSLDRQGPVANWGADESRTYRVAAPQAATLLRFRFLSGENEKILRIYGIELR